jgi:hypothetical protein
MNTDDRIDETLRAIAHAEASRDFTARVRTRLEAGSGTPTAWLRMATALAAVLLVAATTWLLRDLPPLPADQVRATPKPAPRPLPAGLVEPTTSVVVERRPVPVPHGRVLLPETRPSDHERALRPLSPLNAISLPLVAPDAMVVADHVIAPLAPIAPLPIVFDAVEDVDRGEL